MNAIVILILGNIGLILGALFVVGFILIQNNKNKKKSSVVESKDALEILTNKTILDESQFQLNIFLKFFLIVFSIVGLIIIYIGVTFTDVLANKIASIVFGSIFFFVPFIIFIYLTAKYRRILKGKYVIVEDVLMDKKRYNNYSIDSNKNDDWFYLYFEEYFKKYDKKILVNSDVFNKAEIGDKFYIVFTKSDYFVFNSKNYKLIDYNKVISIDELGNYIKIKKQETDSSLNENKEIRVINKERIKNDFSKFGHRKTAVIFIIFCMGMIFLLYLSSFVFKDIIVSVVLLIITCFWIFLTFLKVKYVYNIYRNIKKGNYKIKEDVIVSLDNGLEYKDSNKLISFKFQNYKKIVYTDRRENYDAKIGDKYYLVFVKGEKEPIGIYAVKTNVLG